MSIISKEVYFIPYIKEAFNLNLILKINFH
jgi:hypothetical protein